MIFLVSCESSSIEELESNSFEELETSRNITVTTTSNQNLATTSTSTTSTTSTTLAVSESINNNLKSFSLEEAMVWCSGPVSFKDFKGGYYFFVKHNWNDSFNCDYSDFDKESQNSVVVLIEGESNIPELSPNIVMECSVADYMGLGYSEEALKIMKDLKHKCLLFGGTFSLLWHNSELKNQNQINMFKDLITN